MNASKKSESVVPQAQNGSNGASSGNTTTVSGIVDFLNISVQDLATLGAVVQSVVAAVNNAGQDVPGFINLGATARKAVTKSRPGCEAHIQEMVVGLERYPALGPAGVDTGALQNTLLYLAGLHELQLALSRLQHVVNDTMYARKGAAWKVALNIYASFKRNLSTHPELFPVIEQMTNFLAPRPKPARGAGKGAGSVVTHGAGTSTPAPAVTPAAEVPATPVHPGA